MKTMKINKCVYKIHPIFNLNAASEDGSIIHIVKQKPNFGRKHNHAYMMIGVRQFGQSGQKFYTVHKFVYECWRGLIPDGMQIDHINDDREDNRLCNLQLLTPSENVKKSYKNKTTSNNHKNRKTVKSINIKTKEELYFYSLYSTGQHLNICHNSIQKVCEGITKSALSKKDNCWYKFEYIKDDLPVKYIKSANKRPRKKTDEQIKETKLNWRNKAWTCPSCNTIMKNRYKSQHSKICN